MKNLYLLMAFTYFFMAGAFAQQKPATIFFRNGSFAGSRNVQKGKLNKALLSKIHYSKKNYALLQFHTIPGESERKALLAKGIHLFDYIPGNAYLAEFPDTLGQAGLKAEGVISLYNIETHFKIAQNLADYLKDNKAGADRLIAVGFFGNLSKETVISALNRYGAQLVATKIQPAHVVFVHAPAAALEKIAALPFVSYLREQLVKPMPLNYNGRAAHGIDAISASSGRNLQGKNVTVGVGDNADPSTHVDFTGRLINRNANPPAGHGTHTTGTTGGGGILDPMYKGMAPKATLISQSYYDIITNAPVYINDYNMVLTNNSYTVYAGGCPDGDYDVFSNYADDQLHVYDSLLHVFAAGNDGGSTCSPYPISYGTIKSGFQCAKNVLTVGAIDNSNYIVGDFSSKGPVNDGRLKPEIVAGGVNVYSTFPYNTYGSDGGTSMASPTVAGGLVLLYERYRQLHGGLNPSGALIKAIACNSADDLGNPGPDYAYGFGKLNTRTAVETMENNQVFTGTANNGSSTNFTISGIPAGVLQLKIMLYWTDAPALPNAGAALVNDLDLTATGSDAITHYPLILNPNPANVHDNAAEGADHLNNIEQVVINNPPTGNLTVNVSGTAVPAGPQNYVVAYQFINPSVTVEYPFGNDTWVPGETENIRWSAYGGNGNTFTIEYSPDNGGTWQTISNTVPDATRIYPWTVPATATNTALIRVTRNSAGYSDVSDYNFTVLGQPVVTVTNTCPGYGQLLWNTIPSATQYEIMMLKGDSMQTIASTTDTTYALKGLNKDSSYWVTVRAINNTVAGRRAIAANLIPNGGACALNSKDFTVDALLSPLTGRQFTATQLSSNSNISIELKNLGNISSSGSFNISYQVNGGSIITESSAAVVASNTAFNYTFATTYDFSVPGTYAIRAWVNYPGDTLPLNDTLSTVIKQLQNDPLVLAPAFTEGFESASAASYTIPVMGFTGLDRCDFTPSNSNGRARTFVNTGFARTGNRCATLDQVSASNTSTADSLTTTFNLSNYLPTDQIWLDFYYRNQGNDFSLPGNAVWIRGSDQSAWLPVLTLPITNSSIGVYQSSGGIDVTGILAAASPAQTFSSSFQVKFGEEGFTSANSVVTDGNLDDGFSYDDITLTRAVNDASLVALISPVNACNLSNAEVIKVKVKNFSSSILSNIAVSYKINGNTTVTENIASLAAKDSVIYSFTQTADLSAYQNYTLSTWVACPGDTYHINDSLLNVNFQTSPLIASYPYLQGFENDNGNWFTSGTNDSWQWGTPAKTIINKAANGTKAWVTSLTGTYNNNELSYLYSPCFDLSSLTQPVFSFSHIFQTEDDCDCDYHWVEYSTDDVNWFKLGTVGTGVNWYDNASRQAWQLSNTRWHVSSYDVPVNPAKVRFRIVMNSDPGVTYEGIGIDDVHVFDKSAIYSGANTDAGITQNVSGTNWVNFNVGPNIVAAINPNGQNLGSTTVYAYINTAGVRHTSSQYYLDRNLVIKPANPPTDSIGVRFYFLDAEANNLINATGCPACSSLADAYQAGVTQYSFAPAEEDSTLSNNATGTYNYMLPHSQVSIVPNDNGYYAEYKVTHFSEFWINNGGLGQNQPLPLVLEGFTATKLNSTQGVLNWSVSKAINLSVFVVEKSVDGNNFYTIGTVKAGKDSTGSYQFTDNNLMDGENYYRLKMTDLDGNFQYSPVRDIMENASGFYIRIYPNPVAKGNVYINTSANCNSIELCDISGRVIKTITTFGLQNTLPLDNISKGVYMVIVYTDAGKKIQKIVVE